ncbi:unnamed protein product [Polarella glacialis]|uniref:Uncharacterized protein n=1 Tax=Polarella glacialis TaxID=89957 RepID=A0A813HYU2_POLGL|nr:unnamed protein product [Polarella glacialis]
MATTPGRLPDAKVCGLHKHYPDLDRCDICREIRADAFQDLAPMPTLKQAFPVVAPLSDKRLGCMDVRHPAGVLQKLQAAEDQAGEWAVDRHEAQEVLEKERRRLHLQKHQASKAERAVDAAIKAGVVQVAHANQAAEDRRRRGEQNLQALEVQVRQAEVLSEEAQREAHLRKTEATSLAEQEHTHAMEVEELLRLARENTSAARQRVEEAEVGSRKRLEERDSEIKREMLELHTRVELARQEAESRVQKVQKSCATILNAKQEEVAKAKESIGYRIGVEAQRNVAAKEEANRRRHEAEHRLIADRHGIKQHVTALEEDLGGHLQRVQHREDRTRRHCQEFEAGAVNLLSSKADSLWSEARRKEDCAKASLEQTAYVLGHHYKSRWQYTPTVDLKVSTILQGCLHGRPSDDPRMLMPPSPRVLSPPAELPRLVAISDTT